MSKRQGGKRNRECTPPFCLWLHYWHKCSFLFLVSALLPPSPPLSLLSACMKHFQGKCTNCLKFTEANINRLRYSHGCCSQHSVKKNSFFLHFPDRVYFGHSYIYQYSTFWYVLCSFFNCMFSIALLSGRSCFLCHIVKNSFTDNCCTATGKHCCAWLWYSLLYRHCPAPVMCCMNGDYGLPVLLLACSRGQRSGYRRHGWTLTLWSNYKHKSCEASISSTLSIFYKSNLIKSE